MTARFRAKIYHRPVLHDVSGLDQRPGSVLLEGEPWRFEIREGDSESPVIAGARDTQPKALLAACGYLMGMSPDYSPSVWVDNMLRMMRL